jgi:hypothetical protein
MASYTDQLYRPKQVNCTCWRDELQIPRFMPSRYQLNLPRNKQRDLAEDAMSSNTTLHRITWRLDLLRVVNINVLLRFLRRCLVGHVPFGCDVMKAVLAVNNQLMRGVIDVHIGGKDLNSLRVAKDFGDFLERNTLSFRKQEEHNDDTNSGNDDEDLRTSE